MKNPRTNHEDASTADFSAMLRAARLTEQEAAKAAALHINTVKKIVRGERVHPNSRLKLFRCLRQATSLVVSHPSAVNRDVLSIADRSPETKRLAVQQHAENLARAAGELSVEVVAGRVTLREDEFAKISGFIKLALASLSGLTLTK